MKLGRKPDPAGDERLLKDKAHLLVRKGKLEAATEIYLVLISQNCKDPALRLRHAELCDKLNRHDKAVASYLVAAHLLVKDGHKAKAKAAVTCGLRIKPGDTGLLRAMRELSEPPKLALVPPPEPLEDDEPLESGFQELIARHAEDSDEAQTDPYCPLPEWAEDPSVPNKIGRTVNQRAPVRR
jgi:hypothetical protein